MTNRILKTSWDGDPLMYAAFISCVRWVLSTPDMMRAYREETGDRFVPATSGINRLIDQQTGADFEFFQRLSDWVENRVFGTRDDVFPTLDAAATEAINNLGLVAD